jgi:hypothetical protein
VTRQARREERPLPEPLFRGAVAISGVAMCGLFFLMSCPWPDDWDGLGFLASIRHFNLDAFAPHPPGYPVYVALLKLANHVVPTPLRACLLIAGFCGALTVLFSAEAFRMAFRTPPYVGALVALAVAMTPIAFHAATVVGSEAPALMFASVALYGLAVRSPLAVGIGVGLGLGVRASWAPFYLPMLFLAPRGRRRALVTAAIAILAWMIPFLYEVGPAHLFHILRVHLAGHATRWGGTALTEPGRARFLARDIFIDGLGIDDDPLGIALAIAAAVTAAISLDTWRRAKWIYLGPAVLLIVPYLAWITIGQNLREQPRHALPLVALLAAGLAAAGWADKRARWAAIPLFTLMVVRTGMDANDRRHDPPAAVRIRHYIESLPDSDQVLVFGTASIRYFDGSPLASRTRGAEFLGDVVMALHRVDKMPTRIFTTSEITEERGRRGEKVATFCRPERLDRKRPCLELFEIDPAGILNR